MSRQTPKGVLRFSISLDRDIAEALREEAKARRLAISNIIQDALTTHALPHIQSRVRARK